MPHAAHAHHAPPPAEYELREAVEAGDAALCRALVERGADREARDAYGKTALHDAVIHAHEDVLEVLCDAGCDIEARDVNGRTPLGFAAAGGKVRLAALLLNRGAHREAHDDLHDTLHRMASENGHTSIDDMARAHVSAPAN